MTGSGGRREARGVGAPRFLGRLWLLASVAVTLAGAHARSEPAAQAGPDSLVIDRWLVSDPLRAEGSHLGRAAEGVAGELLKAPIDASFEGTGSDWLFPDRDVEFGPAYWNLVRADSTSSFDLDTLAFFQDRPARAVILAHAYLRSREERTVVLATSGPSCGTLETWLNGQLLPDSRQAVPVRLAAGWNALLVALGVSDCPARLSAALRPAADDPGGLSGIRIQASRPPGVQRTYPQPWITVAHLEVGGELAWRAGAEDLEGALAFQATVWGPAAEDTTFAQRPADTAESEPPFSAEPPEGAEPGEPPGGAEPGEPTGGVEPPEPGEPPEGARRPRRRGGRGGGGFGPVGRNAANDVRLRLLPRVELPPPAPESARAELKLAGAKVQTEIRGLAPARPAKVGHTFRFEVLRKAALSESGVEIELRWRKGGRKVRLPLSAASVLRRLHEPIALKGWADSSGAPAAGVGGRSVDAARSRPAMIAGRIAAGTWRVPEALAGFSLDLFTDGAPGEYRLNGSPLSGEAGRFRLCGPCRKDRKLELRVRATDEWTREPRVQVAEGGFPAAAGRPGAPPAAEWLRALGKDQNRRYLELSSRYADSGSAAPSTSEGGASVPPSSLPLRAGRVDSPGGG